MNNEKIRISLEQQQKISEMLRSQGISETEIDQIINGDYEVYSTGDDLESSFGGLKKHGDVLEKLSDGYTMEELQTQGISTQKIQAFNEMLQSKNLTVDNAKAIYQYSVGSNMILGVKRGTSKETIQSQIMSDLEESLQARGVPQANIDKMKQFVKSADYESTLHSNYDMANDYMEQMGIQQNSRVSVRSAMQSMDRCTHIDETIASLDEGLGSTHLDKSMKLYRAVKSSYLEKGLKEGEDLSSLVGKNISNKGQTSTSPLYDSSFASLDEYDTVFEIYAPKGSRGSYIAELSAYDKTEQEVLLNPNDLYITDVQTGVVDKNGRTKNVLQVLCLSKDRECYKEVEQQKAEQPRKSYEQTMKQGQSQNQTYEQGMDQEQLSTMNSANLPARQNRFSKFFSQVRSRFAKQKSQSQEFDNSYAKQQTKVNSSQPKEKKSWELEPEEKARIQKETAEIAKRHREQEEKQSQQTQVQQQNVEQSQQNQNDAQMIQGQIPQQPMMDMGGMEL